jgi:hypothetical protein
VWLYPKIIIKALSHYPKMFYLKSDDHILNIRKLLYEDDEYSDLSLVCEGSTFHCHSSLILQQVPTLTELLCQGCQAGHINIVIFLPGVMAELVEVALLEFYIKSDPTKLRSVLNVSSVTLHGNVIDVSKDTDKLHTQLNVSSVTTTKYNGTETSEDTEKVYTLMDESNNSSYIDKAENNISTTTEDNDGVLTILTEDDDKQVDNEIYKGNENLLQDAFKLDEDVDRFKLVDDYDLDEEKDSYKALGESILNDPMKIWTHSNLLNNAIRLR